MKWRNCRLKTKTLYYQLGCKQAAGYPEMQFLFNVEKILPTYPVTKHQEYIASLGFLHFVLPWYDFFYLFSKWPLPYCVRPYLQIALGTGIVQRINVHVLKKFTNGTLFPV